MEIEERELREARERDRQTQYQTGRYRSGTGVGRVSPYSSPGGLPGQRPVSPYRSGRALPQQVSPYHGGQLPGQRSVSPYHGGGQLPGQRPVSPYQSGGTLPGQRPVSPYHSGGVLPGTKPVLPYLGGGGLPGTSTSSTYYSNPSYGSTYDEVEIGGKAAEYHCRRKSTESRIALYSVPSGWSCTLKNCLERSGFLVDGVAKFSSPSKRVIGYPSPIVALRKELDRSRKTQPKNQT